MTEYGWPQARIQRDQGRVNGIGDTIVKTEGKILRFQPTVEHSLPSASIEDIYRRPRSRQPVIPSSGLPGPALGLGDIPQPRPNVPFTANQPPPKPPHHSHSRSHSRSRHEPATSSVDSNLVETPFVPPRPNRWYKPAPMPSVVPPGYPEGTTWILDSSGRPKLETPAQHIVRCSKQSPATFLAGNGRQHDRHQARAVEARLQLVDDDPRTLTSQPSEEYTARPRSRSPGSYASPCRSNARSRHQLKQEPLAPFVPPRQGRQHKPAPVPSVIPPGFPAGTRWVVDSSGRPRLETPEQYQARYRILLPSGSIAGQGIQQPVFHTPNTQPWFPPNHTTQPQTSFIQQPRPVYAQASTTTLPQASKPLFKRIFGGIIGCNKSARTPGPTQEPLVSSAPPSRPTSKANQVSRTKSC